MTIRKGDRAPGFELPAKPGEPINVGDDIGNRKVVLLFFPFAYSPVCTKEMCTMRESWAKWSDLGAAIYGISIDSPFVVAKFREDEEIPFPILADFNKDVIQQYGVMHEELRGLKGVAKRAAIVVGSDGVVAYDWVSEDPGVQVDFDAIEQALASAP